MPLYGATCWLGVFFMFLANFMRDIPACNLRGTSNMRQRASIHMGVCAYMYDTIYMLIFSLDCPTSGHEFPQYPRGLVSQHAAKRVETGAWHISNRGPCVELNSHNTHGRLAA